MLAKLIAASQSHSGVVPRGGASSLRNAGLAAAGALPLPPPHPDTARGRRGPSTSNDGSYAHERTSNTAPGEVASAVAAAATASAGAAKRASWEGGSSMAKSFKRLSGLLLPTSPPASAGSGHNYQHPPVRSASGEDMAPQGGSAGASASGEAAAGGGGGGTGPVRMLIRMISGKRRSEGLAGTSSLALGGIATVEEEGESVSLPTPPPLAGTGGAAGMPATALSPVGGGGGGAAGGGAAGGGGSAAVEDFGGRQQMTVISAADAPPTALAGAVLGRSVSRRSQLHYHLPADLHTTPPQAHLPSAQQAQPQPHHQSQPQPHSAQSLPLVQVNAVSTAASAKPSSSTGMAPHP